MFKFNGSLLEFSVMFKLILSVSISKPLINSLCKIVTFTLFNMVKFKPFSVLSNYEINKVVWLSKPLIISLTSSLQASLITL